MSKITHECVASLFDSLYVMDSLRVDRMSEIANSISSTWTRVLVLVIVRTRLAKYLSITTCTVCLRGPSVSFAAEKV